MFSMSLNRLVTVAAVLVLLSTFDCLAQSSVTEKNVRDEFTDAVVTNPTLHGTWVDLKQLTSPNAHGNEYELDVIVDTQPEIEKAQLSELSRIVKTIPKSFGLEPEINVIGRLPFRQFIAELKREVEFAPDLAGAAFEDAFYFDDSNTDVSVVLVGRYMVDAQSTKIIHLANSRIGKLFGDSVRGIRQAVATTERFKRTEGRALIQKRPSAETAGVFFDLGLQKFIGHHYDEAYVSFTRAYLEAPTRIEIQYWRVVSLLGGDHENDAKTLLQGVVESKSRNEQAMKRDAAAINRSLEPVQGTLRQKLTALENSLVAKTRN